MVPVPCGEHGPEFRKMRGVRRELQSREDGRCGRRIQVAVDIVVAGRQALEQRPVQRGEPHGGVVRPLLHGPGHGARAGQNPVGTAEQSVQSLRHDVAEFTAVKYEESCP
ncbi:hypothetical protein [Streptomyces sp. NPDC057582]|uniref:hypothetical protein n=1 Tax=unclassified Streptomyces TaxID=2593676 RepID=UPI0036836036